MSGQDAVNVTALREALTVAVAGLERCRQEAERHRQEADRWQRRIALAEQRGESDLATEAARLARQHAARAQAALAQHAKQRAAAQEVWQTVKNAAPGGAGSLGQSFLSRRATESVDVPHPSSLSLEEQLADLKRRLTMGTNGGQP